MGIENRDYNRGAPAGGYGYSGFGPGGKSAVMLLLIANVAVYLLQAATLDPRGGSEGITAWLDLNLADLQRGEVWRLLTYGFCHDPFGIGHIFWNMFGLWMFGRLIEPNYGWKEFLAFYLVGILLSGLGHIVYQSITGSPAGAVGASGGVMAVVMTCAMTYPRHKVLLFFVIPVEFRIMAVLYVAGDLFGLMHSSSAGGGVAHAAHLAGAAWGLAYKYYNLRVLGGWWQRLTERTRSLPKRNPNVRLHQPEEPGSPAPPPAKAVPPINLDEEVDMILEKIYVQGESSLTDRERDILKQASRRYRKE